MNPPAADAGGDFLAELRDRARARPRKLVFPEGTEPRVQHAVAAGVGAGLFEAVLIGAPDEIRAGLEHLDCDASAVAVTDPVDADLVQRTRERLRARRADKGDTEEQLMSMASDPLMQAGGMVASGEVDGSVAGCVRTTSDVVRAGLTCVGLADGIETLSSSFYMVFESGHRVGPRVLTFTDAGVVPSPTARQLAGIAAAAVGARRRPGPLSDNAAGGGRRRRVAGRCRSGA